jgi:hypothetical protein
MESTYNGATAIPLKHAVSLREDQDSTPTASRLARKDPEQPGRRLAGFEGA